MHLHFLLPDVLLLLKFCNLKILKSSVTHHVYSHLRFKVSLQLHARRTLTWMDDITFNSSNYKHDFYYSVWVLGPAFC